MNRWAIEGDQARARVRELAVSVDAHQRSGRLEASEVAGLNALWWDLVEGRCRLADCFEKDGRRYYVAYDRAPGMAPPSPLSPKERTVVALLGAGQSGKSAQSQLGATTSTVSTVLARTLAKLGMRSRTDLVLLMRAAGVSSGEMSCSGPSRPSDRGDGSVAAVRSQ